MNRHDRGFALFDTALGTCGLAWDREDRIVAVALPEPDARDVVDYLRGFDATEQTPPEAIGEVVESIGRLFAGEDVDLSAIVVDVADLPEFDRRVYAVTRSIPRGRTLTYGQVAARIGQPLAAQAVGRSLGRNPIPVVIPCHRVLGAGTEVGGFSAPGGAATKGRILAAESVPGFGEPTLF